MRPQDIPTDQRPASDAAWHFLTEQWESGLFTVTREPDGAYTVHFSDDGEDFPLADMAYNSDLGLFHRSPFPHEPEE